MDRRDVLCALGGLSVLGLPTTGHAYLLPTKHVLDRAAKVLVRSKGLTALMAGQVQPVGDGAPVEVGERWIFGPALTISVKGPDGRSAGFDGSADEAAQSTGVVELLPRAPVRIALETLFGQADPSGLMTTIGARRDAQSLALIGQRPVHVLGAAAGQKGQNSLWIDQDDFIVRRVRFGTDAGRCDIRLDAWSGPTTGGRFPHRISVRLAGRAIRTLRVTRVV